MPETRRQQRAAGAELARRRRGVKKTKESTPKRPMGNVPMKTLLELATGPIK